MKLLCILSLRETKHTKQKQQQQTFVTMAIMNKALVHGAMMAMFNINNT